MRKATILVAILAAGLAGGVAPQPVAAQTTSAAQGPTSPPTRTGEIAIGDGFAFRSRFLAGEVPVRVHLPPDYGKGDTRYPVLVLLDIAGDFVFASAVSDFLAQSGRIPPLLVASVDVGKLSGPPQAMIDFLDKELLPHLDFTYRTTPKRVLYGHSGRAFAALYILLTRPDLFDGYICPGLGLTWPLEQGRLDFAPLAEKRFAASHSLPKVLVFSLGDEKRFFAGVERFVALLKEKAPADLRWTYLQMPEDDHASTRLKTLYQGLEFIFRGVTARP